MGLLSAGQLNLLRGVALSAMVTPCTISRGGSLLSPQPTMPDGTPLRCRITRDTKESRIEGASRLEEQTRWRISFPADLDVRAGDQVTALGNIYGVVEPRNPATYSVSTDVVAYMLYDANGTPVYLRPNATVSTTRDGVTKLVRVVAGIDEPSPEDMAPEGGIVRHVAYLLPSSDIRAGDMLTIQSWPPFTIDPTRRYAVFSAGPQGIAGLALCKAVIGEWSGR